MLQSHFQGTGTPANHDQSHYPHIEKTGNSGDPSQQWSASQDYCKSGTTTHPGGHSTTQNIIWEPKASYLARNISEEFWYKKNWTAFDERNMIQQSDVVVTWWSGAASGPGPLAVTDPAMNSAVYQRLPKGNIWPLVHDLKLTWVMEQEDDVKPTSGGLDVNWVEMLRCDLTQGVHAGKPFNVAGFNLQCCKEWVRVPPQRCERLIASYHKCLIATKVRTTSYEVQGMIAFSHWAKYVWVFSVNT